MSRSRINAIFPAAKALMPRARPATLAGRAKARPKNGMTATTSLAQALSAQDIIRYYDLMPHVEGGHYRRIWCSSQDLQPESLPCGICGSRPCSTSILYLLQAGERSRLHRIRQDELWHFHLGGPLRLYCLTPDGQELDRILGADILARSEEHTSELPVTQ